MRRLLQLLFWEVVRNSLLIFRCRLVKRTENEILHTKYGHPLTQVTRFHFVLFLTKFSAVRGWRWSSRGPYETRGVVFKGFLILDSVTPFHFVVQFGVSPFCLYFTIEHDFDYSKIQEVLEISMITLLLFQLTLLSVGLLACLHVPTCPAKHTRTHTHTETVFVCLWWKWSFYLSFVIFDNECLILTGTCRFLYAFCHVGRV